MGRDKIGGGEVASLTEAGRYQLIAPVGRGAMGLVYRARDTRLARDVALKTLRTSDPEEIYQLKKEFRLLSQLSHPNLVQLYELVVTADQCFFTMEFVDGSDLVRYVRRDGEFATGEEIECGRVDYVRLRDSLHQLAAGLHALHSYGKIHRDVKPANVLVERGGRVVLLDFGLATGLFSAVSRDSRLGSLAGTLAYMAPEQAVGGEISPASDLYSVGIVLYEALTGRIPFDGAALVSVIKRTRAMPPSPRTIVPETPLELDELTMNLLSVAPERRPTAQQVLARLASWHSEQRVPATLRSAGPGDVPFIGRSRELAELGDAFDAARRDGLVTLSVTGTSGIGKTALIEQFLSTVAVPAGALILTARCHPRESIPFKAVDGAVDDLARFLTHQPDDKVEAILARDIGALARIFPVLGRVKAIAASVVELRGREPQEIRRRAFSSLRDLLGRVGDRRPVVLWIDDLQWGDLDSVALLRVLRAMPDAPRILLILSFRSDEADAAAIVRLFDDYDVAVDTPEPPRRMCIEPLPDYEARDLVRRIIVEEGASASDRVVEGIAREAGGSPFFTCELARLLAAKRSGDVGAEGDSMLRLSRLVTQRITDLSRADKMLLEIVSVAGEPVLEEIIHKLGTGDVSRALSRLRAHRLLRTAMLEGRPAVDTYHDRVREAVVRLLPEGSYRSLHREMAAALESLPNPDPQRLVEHYIQANDLARAGERAFASAERAVEALAFHQASRLYRRALELKTNACPMWVLHAKLGTTLANMGRGGEAATSFLAAAEELAAHDEHSPEVLRLKRQAATHYMQCGLHDEGLDVLREVLARVGLTYTASPKRVILSLIVNRARLWLTHKLPLLRAVTRPGPRDTERLEACWSAGVGLGVSDTLRAADFQVRHALLAQRVGDAAHRARALAIEALLMVWEGGERKRRRAARLRIESERLARATGDPNVEVYSLVLRAIGAFFERRLSEAVSLTDRAETLCREKCVGVAWELANVQVIGVSARVFLGDMENLGRRVETMLREARERNDYYCLFMGRLGFVNMAWLAADRPEEARRQANAALAQPFPETFTWPVYQGALAHAHIDLYLGDGRAGWRRMQEAWAALRAGSMLRLQTVRIEMRELRARCAVQMAADLKRNSSVRRRLLRFAARAAGRVAAEDVRWAAPFVDGLRASIAAVMGDTPNAKELFENAALGFDHLEMSLHAAAIRLQLAKLLPASEGARLGAEQDGWLRSHGVQNPQRLAALLAPTIPPS